MKVKLTHVETGFKQWYMNEVATINLWLAFATPVVMLAVANLERKNSIFLGILFDENDEIDIDDLHKQYKEILDQKGSLTLYGLKVNSQDLDKLVDYIKKAVPPKVAVK